MLRIQSSCNEPCKKGIQTITCHTNHSSFTHTRQIIIYGSQACKLDLETEMTCELMMLENGKLKLLFSCRMEYQQQHELNSCSQT